MKKVQELSLGWPSRKLTSHLRQEFEKRVTADLFEKRRQDLLKETKKAGPIVYNCLWGGSKNLKLAKQLPDKFFAKTSYITMTFNAKVGNVSRGQQITLSFDGTKARDGSAYGGQVNFNECEQMIIPSATRTYGVSSSTALEFKDNLKLQKLGKKWCDFYQEHNTVMNKIREILGSVNTEKQLINTWPDSHKYMTPPNVVMSIVPSIQALDELIGTLKR